MATLNQTFVVLKGTIRAASKVAVWRDNQTLVALKGIHEYPIPHDLHGVNQTLVVLKVDGAGKKGLHLQVSIRPLRC